jgi:hypothetical protein
MVPMIRCSGVREDFEKRALLHLQDQVCDLAILSVGVLGGFDEEPRSRAGADNHPR